MGELCIMRYVVITGAASGLGYELAKQLTEKGFKVFSIDKSHAGIDMIQGVTCFDVDITDIDRVLWVGKQINKITDSIDILINNAGVITLDWFEDLKMKDWDLNFNTNTKAIVYLVKVFLTSLKKSKGTVVNIISRSAYRPKPAWLSYNASKSASYMLTQQLSIELTNKYDITVLGICPSYIEGTKMTKYIQNRVEEIPGLKKFFMNVYPMPGLFPRKPTNLFIIAELITFILESKERHDYLSGCILDLGG